MNVQPHIAALSIAGFVALAASSSALPGGTGSAVEGRAYGFVITKFSLALYESEEDCPGGYAMDSRQAYLSTQTPAERTRLQLPENTAEFLKNYGSSYIRDSQGRDICRHPKAFDHPPYPLVKGPVAYGLDLDGKASHEPSANTCAHGNFTGADGATNVDSQFYRAIGCVPRWRGLGGAIADDVNNYNKYLLYGGRTTLLVISDVDDLVNDPDITLTIASSDDPPVVSPKQEILDGTSFTLTGNQRWRNVVRAQIVNDVVTTSTPVDIRLRRLVVNSPTEWDLRRARFKLQLTEDGGFTGILGAYWPIDNAYAQRLERWRA